MRFRRTRLMLCRGPLPPVEGAGAVASAMAITCLESQPAGVEPVAVAPVPVPAHAAGVDPIGLETSVEDLLHAIPKALILIGDIGVVTLANRQAEQIFRAAPGGLVGHSVADLLPAYLSLPAGMIDTGAEMVARRADGSEFPAEISLTPLPSAGGPTTLVLVRDVTARKRTEEALLRHALHDSLTGLPNRVLLLDRLTMALARSGRASARVGVLFLDVDRFKVFNDSRGHAAGDALLRGVGLRLREAMRPSDTVARFGGDEFVVVCDDFADETEALRVGDRVLRALREPLEIGSEEVFVSGTIGIALAAPDSTPETLLQDADAAMYRAKERGRSRCELFDHTMRREAASRLATQGDLHRALERGELWVAYQPVVSLATGEVVAAEALVRWSHPERGLISPGEFVPLAEEGGLIVPIGNWVFEESVRQWGRWQSEHPERAPLVLHVNLSPRQLQQQEFLGFVHYVLDRYGVDPSAVCVELTETVLMEDLEQRRSPLSELRDLGLRIALDDFGTGYSSLTYLKRFPVDTIKIDQSFVAGVAANTYDAAIVQSIIDLAHAVGLVVVAEGVETIEQLESLRELGCDHAQGFLFSAARPTEELEALLSTVYLFDVGGLNRRPGSLRVSTPPEPERP
jgi:diguanylate cyclase (GGDEF)-like protein/PAS domain S-box-containing protein